MAVPLTMAAAAAGGAASGAGSNAFAAAVAIWGLNGFVQAFAWPALTRVFMAWFPSPAQRGAW
jgi:sugar phosphate permease